MIRTPTLTRASLIGCGAATLLAGLVYINALHNPFVYDDYRTILDNGSITTLTNPRAIVLHDVTRPVVNLSYAIDRTMWGPEPFGFHVTSVLLHMLNVWLLFWLAWRMVDDFGDSSIRPAVVAVVAAALFAVHPVMTEAVAYVSGRSEVLCATWFLVGLLCARRWMHRGGTHWWLLTAGFWMAGLLTKEIAAMFPLVLLAYDRLLLNGDPADRRRRFLRLHLPMLGLTALAGTARMLVFLILEHPDAVGIQWRAILVELNVVTRYVGLLVAPTGQTIFHDVSPVVRLLSIEAWWGAVAVALLLVLAWQRRRAHAIVSLGIWWFLLLLVPSSALVVLGHGEGMAEHRVYLASCGLFLATGALSGWTVARLVPAPQRVPWLGYGLLIAALLSLSGRTMMRNAVWSSQVTIWREATDLAPNNPLPRTVLAESLQIAGRHDEAIEEYREALRLNPFEETVYLKLGMSLAQTGRFDEAVLTFETLRQFFPDSPIVSTGLGVVAMLGGQTDVARQHFQQTIAQHPRDIMSRQWLATLEEEVAANPAEALRLCEEVRQIAPGKLSDDECVTRNRAALDALSAGSF